MTLLTSSDGRCVVKSLTAMESWPLEGAFMAPFVCSKGTSVCWREGGCSEGVTSEFLYKMCRKARH